MSKEIFYKPDEIASQLKVSRNTLYEIIKRGELEAYHIGKSIRISNAQFATYTSALKNRQPAVEDDAELPPLQGTGGFSKRYPAISKAKLFEGFDKSERDEVCEALRPESKEYSKNEIIAHYGDRIDYIAVVCCGSITESKIDYQGNSNLFEILGKSKTFGIEVASTPSQISPFVIKSFERTTVLRFSYDRITKGESISVQQRIQLQHNLFQILAYKNRNSLCQTELNFQKSLRSKILTYLEFMCEMTGKKTFQLEMDREQFARYLSVPYRILSNELKRMEENGLITCNRNEFTLTGQKRESELLAEMKFRNHC